LPDFEFKNKFKKILFDNFSEMREQHESEIHNLENLMKASQDMLQQQVTKYSDQMQRLGKDLFCPY
jgi:hypothetical protein